MIETIPAALDGERLDRLVAMLSDVSRAEAAQLVADGAVRLDGVVVTSGKLKVREGQRLEVDDSRRRQDTGPRAEPDVQFDVVHADEAVIVVDKPAGLVVHPGAGTRSGTLVNGLLARYPEVADVGERDRPGIVHRLDRGTSGLLVVARTPAAQHDLVGQLSRRTVERRYHALVWGVPAAAAGLIDAPIGRSPRDPTRRTVAADGREARTRYHVDRAFEQPDRSALLTCRLETGRTHQIRVHLAAIDHPVVGDAMYGHRDSRSFGIDRPFLHAGHLAFDHPLTGERVAFEVPLPNDLQEVLDRLT